MKKSLFFVLFCLSVFLVKGQSLTIDPSTPFAACSGGPITVNFTPSAGLVGPFTVELVEFYTRFSQAQNSSCNYSTTTTKVQLSTSQNSINLSIPVGLFNTSGEEICAFTPFGTLNYRYYNSFTIKVSNGTVNSSREIKLYSSPCPALLGAKTSLNTYPSNSKINLSFLTNGINPGNVFSFQLSDKFGSFATPVPLNTPQNARLLNTNDVTDLTIPSGTVVGTNYLIKVISTAPLSNVISNQFSITAPLPITLLNFTAKYSQQGNQLKWQTASEKDFSHFEIQRSENAQKFENIGEVKGTGSESYEFVDSQLLDSIIDHLTYYRLRMIDLDGKYEYSKILSVANKSESAISVYPNPASDFINVSNENGKSLNLNLLDAMGRSHKQLQNIKESPIEMNVKTVPKGIYFLQINNGEKIEYRKIIKE
jgi:hypothetical protein